jgi:hypothetical protein
VRKTENPLKPHAEGRDRRFAKPAHIEAGCSASEARSVAIQGICRNKLVRVLKLRQHTESLVIDLSRAAKVPSKLYKSRRELVAIIHHHSLMAEIARPDL